MEHRHMKIASVYTGPRETHTMRKARHDEERRALAKISKHKNDYDDED